MRKMPYSVIAVAFLSACSIDALSRLNDSDPLLPSSQTLPIASPSISPVPTPETATTSFPKPSNLSNLTSFSVDAPQGKRTAYRTNRMYLQVEADKTSFVTGMTIKTTGNTRLFLGPLQNHDGPFGDCLFEQGTVDYEVTTAPDKISFKVDLSSYKTTKVWVPGLLQQATGDILTTTMPIMHLTPKFYGGAYIPLDHPMSKRLCYGFPGIDVEDTDVAFVNSRTPIKRRMKAKIGYSGGSFFEDGTVETSVAFEGEEAKISIDLKTYQKIDPTPSPAPTSWVD